MDDLSKTADGSQDLKPPFKKLIRDPNAVAIPLEASNTARFEVVS